MKQEFRFEVESMEEGSEALSFAHNQDKQARWIGPECVVSPAVHARLETEFEKEKIMPRHFITLKSDAFETPSGLLAYIPPRYRKQFDIWPLRHATISEIPQGFKEHWSGKLGYTCRV